MGHTSFQFNRRSFLQAGLLAAGTVAFSPGFFRKAFADTVTVGQSPYGPLQPFDANGIALPQGFSSREIARGASLVDGSTPPYLWHNLTDGQATFPTLGAGGEPDGGWILVANSEVPIPLLGGVSGIEFAPGGEVESAYRVLAGTFNNCAGGPTPWGTWLSCEEHDLGTVHECDPTTLNVAVSRPAMGVFSHEAACVDPVRQRVYLTEDKPNGCLYRFTPTVYPNLAAGLLEVAQVDALNSVTWAQVPDPQGGVLNPTRTQVAGAAHFDGGEGTWYDDGIVYFTTKGDQRVWAYHVQTSKLEVLYDDDSAGPDAPLSGVDNITVSPSGDIFVCEDSRDHDICMITPDFKISRFLKLDPTVHSGSPLPVIGNNETVGVVFNPAGDRMYFGAQRSFGTAGVNLLPAGVVYEITGPFRQTAPGPALSVLDKALTLRAPKRLRMRRFLRFGLPIELELDQPAGVDATLRIEGGKAGGRPRTLAHAAPSVAVNGTVGLTLKANKRARRLLRGERRATAKLSVTVTTDKGPEVLTRSVMLVRK